MLKVSGKETDVRTATVVGAYPPWLPKLDNDGWALRSESCQTPNYGVRRVALVRGEGTRVWDADGKEYLDFLAGISVNNLGHCHPRITEVIRRQASALVHCTNLYTIPMQIELGRLLLDHGFADRVFFGNSGAEANEAAIKIARRWNRENRGPDRHEIICFEGSFHGRTMATLTATGQPKVKTNFEPLLEGFVHVPYNDLEAARASVGERTGAILVEPVLGEGGVRPATREFLAGLRELCDERDLLLIFDEIQCGLGRIGHLFAYQHYGVEPDIMTLGKSLGGGLPMGAMLCRERVAMAFSPGSHGSTMGGNPLASAAGHAYVSELIQGNWPARARETGEYLVARFKEAVGTSANIKEIRCVGLMIGIELYARAPEVLVACEEAGLLINVTDGQTLRLLPPLNVSREGVDLAVQILGEAIHAHPAEEAT